MKLTEISRNSVKRLLRLRAKRAAVTNRLYRFEEQHIETIKNLKKQRSLDVLQKVAKEIWKKHGKNVRWKMPDLRFGPGDKSLGRPLSYTYGFEYIELATGQRNIVVLVHELAHALGPYQHGILFANLYWKLLKDFIPNNDLKEFIKDELLKKHPLFVKKVYKK